MTMWLLLEIIQQAGAPRCPSNGRGNGRLLVVRKTKAVAGGTPAAFVAYLLFLMDCEANCLKFVEYDSRAHRLHTLAAFSYWVSSMLGRLKLQSLLVADKPLFRFIHNTNSAQLPLGTVPFGVTTQDPNCFSSIGRLSPRRRGY